MLYRCILGSVGHFIFFGLLIILSIPGYFAYLIASLFMKEPQYVFQLGSSYSYKLFFLLAPNIVLRTKLRDDLPQNAIYISTHQSILDFPALSTFIRDYLFFANVNLGKIPIVASVCDLAGVRYINSKGIDEISRIYDEFELHIRDKKNVIFFPEGTRHEGKDLKPFKRGAFRLSKKTSTPIIPIVVEGANKLLPRKAFCFATSKSTTIHVNMLETLYPQDFSSDREMMRYAQKIMQQEKDRLCDIS
ncbi:MAG: lysophospholipid acyltransferase family protein [Campylobacterota bacterium]|nr:lysophospholipid acyltransferase family protein [Campylobacterota bacterium]